SATGLSPAGYFRPWNLLRSAAILVPLKLGAYLPPAALRLMSRSTFGRFVANWSLYRHPGRYTPERVYRDALAMKGASAFWPYFVRCIPLGFRTPSILCGTAKVPITIAWGDHDLILHTSQAKLAREKLSGA